MKHNQNLLFCAKSILCIAKKNRHSQIFVANLAVIVKLIILTKVLWRRKLHKYNIKFNKFAIDDVIKYE